MAKAAAGGGVRAARVEAAPTTPDPIEIAMGAEAHDEAIDSPAREVLRKHARLLDRQIMGETISSVLKLLAGLGGLIVAGALAMLVWSAMNERGLVIEPFSVPPEFAERGLTGEVVASKVLDRLSEMQEATYSARAPSTYANNWNGDIKVEIPETGISVGELRRFLVQWLGHQTAIGGEVYRTPTGIALAARTGTAAAKTHEGAEAELDSLIQAAAEDVYRQTQPYRYAIFLNRKGDEASLAASKEVLTRLTRSDDVIDRIWAYAALNLALQGEGDLDGAVRAATAAVELEPRFNLAYANRSGALAGMGRSEAAFADNRKAWETARRYGKDYMRPAALAYILPSWEGGVASGLGDFSRGAALSSQAGRSGGQEQSILVAVSEWTLAHDLAAARRELGELSPLPVDAPPAQQAARAVDLANVDAGFAFETEDWAGVVRAFEKIPPSLTPGDQLRRLVTEVPLAAWAKAKMGDTAGAEALIATTRPDCDQCTITRGVIASEKRDWKAADAYFARAVRQAPSLPFAPTEWGRSLMARGDYAAAAEKFAQANRKGPRYADALELWGEALMQQGDHRGALKKFRAAEKLTPNWGRNHLRLAQALLALDKREEAVAHLRTASRLHLTPTDKAQLAAAVALASRPS